MIDPEDLAAFVTSPDAPQILRVLGQMTPEQRGRALGTLKALKGGETIVCKPYAVPPAKRREVREAHVKTLLNRSQTAKDTEAHQASRETGRKLAPHWGSHIDRFFKAMEPEPEPQEVTPEAEKVYTAILEAKRPITGMKLSTDLSMSLGEVNAALDLLSDNGVIRMTVGRVAAWEAV